MGRSIVLYGQTKALAAGAQLGVTVPNDLRNPFGSKPMLVEELRFMTDLKALALGLDNTDFALSGAGQIGVSLQLSNNIPLSNGLVPVWLYGYQLSRESLQNATLQDNFTWVLPRPMLLAPGESITPQFHLAPLPAVPVGTFHAYFAIAGREATDEEAAAEEVYLPYITSFSGGYQAGGKVYTEKSLPNHLVNPNSSPLMLDGFTGRVQLYDGFNFQEAVQAYSHAAQTTRTTISLYAQGTTPIVKDPIPFAHLFAKTTRCWHARGVVQPKNYYIAKLSEDFSAYGSGNTFQVQISMFGSRAVKRWWS